MLTYFHDTNDIFIMCDGLDKLGGPTSVTGIPVKVFVVFFSDFAHCELLQQGATHLAAPSFGLESFFFFGIRIIQGNLELSISLTLHKFNSIIK